jgi:hypothetical protein
MYWKSTIFALGLAIGLVAPRGASTQESDPLDPTQSDVERAAREKNERAEERRLTRNVQTLRDMQGGWLLSELRSTVLQEAGRQDIAYLVVAGEFMAFEIHMGYFDQRGNEEESYLQSGIYRLNFNVYGDMIAKLLIGTLDLGFGTTSPRVPGMTSVYAVEVGEGRLVMTAEDGTRFAWTKLKSGKLTQRLYEELDWLKSDGAAREETAAEAPESNSSE